MANLENEMSDLDQFEAKMLQLREDLIKFGVEGLTLATSVGYSEAQENFARGLKILGVIPSEKKIEEKFT